ncbi:MAG: gliding motility-associated C-terminal domain-containing protein, partial [Muribaculaceae bacterium]|nr:gliding motility-associated C-terminal domain-containing protein [Muribaculaceae bacterium]
VESDVYSAVGVEATTTATQEVRENDNEQKTDTDNLGGSAPAVVHFHAAVTDAAIFREWQLARDAEFEIVDNRYQQLDLDYTFTESGVTYVRFVANNAAGTCEYAGDVYQISIGESALLCPNAFSPGASEGVNDEWKVSYKSIVKYECHIFNRWGKEMFSSTDPAIGWDGKQGGKVVPAGVYYYVIVAEGSDGKKYKLSGDINILKSKTNMRGPSPED